jgi:hypothetical protein
MPALIALALAALIITVSAVWEGFVLTKLWAWFVVTTFGLPILTLLPAIGVGLVIDLVTPRGKQTKDTRDEGEQFEDAITYALFSPAIVLLVGWVVHSLMVQHG